jgi:hypothetical protein
MSKMHLAAWIISALLFCWLFISVAATVFGSFRTLFRTIRESYRDRVVERRREREAEKWGLR